MRRYFAATALGGRLFLSEVVYRDETVVDMTFKPSIGERKVKILAELEDVLRVSAGRPLPAVPLWIAEGLEEVARRRREQSR